MSTEAFERLYEQLQKLYYKEDYETALKLASESRSRFPEQRAALDYWRMTMAARLGKAKLAKQILREAIEQGEWYSELLLRRSPSFRSLQDDPEFESLVSRNQEIAEKDHNTNYPLYTLRPEKRCQSGGTPCPLLLGLHGNATTAQSSIAFWAPAATAGWLVAAPQSSQAIWKDAYVWDDRQNAGAEIQRHYQSILDRYAIDVKRTVIAGHSTGGELAIWLALNRSFKVRGFLAISPETTFLTDPDEWRPLLDQEASAGLRGCILIGEKDTSINIESIQIFIAQLEQANIPCRLEVIPLAGRHYDPVYDSAVLSALAFITAE
jgi:predicted esterase